MVYVFYVIVDTVQNVLICFRREGGLHEVGKAFQATFYVYAIGNAALHFATGFLIYNNHVLKPIKCLNAVCYAIVMLSLL